jgi:hypothetical protein
MTMRSRQHLAHEHDNANVGLYRDRSDGFAEARKATPWRPMQRRDFPPVRTPLEIAGHQMMVWLRRIGSGARGILNAWRDAHVALGKDPGGAAVAYDYLNRVFRRSISGPAAPLRPQYSYIDLAHQCSLLERLRKAHCRTRIAIASSRIGKACKAAGARFGGLSGRKLRL